MFIGRQKFVFHQHKIHINFMLLAPFNNFRLKVDLPISNFINIHKRSDKALLYKFFTLLVAIVEINGAHQSFKGIAINIIVGMCIYMFRSLHQFVEPYFKCQTIKGVTFYNFRARIGQKTFSFVFVPAKQNICHH